jgi:hypothetical protein
MDPLSRASMMRSTRGLEASLTSQKLLARFVIPPESVVRVPDGPRGDGIRDRSSRSRYGAATDRSAWERRFDVVRGWRILLVA